MLNAHFVILRQQMSHDALQPCSLSFMLCHHKVMPIPVWSMRGSDNGKVLHDKASRIAELDVDDSVIDSVMSCVLQWLLI